MYEPMIWYNFTVFINGKYQPMLSVFRTIEDGGKLRILTRFRLNKDMDISELSTGVQDLVLVYRTFGPRDVYKLEDIVLYAHSPRVRRKWITIKEDDCAWGYIEYWTDDWRHKV